jgi:group I intron endonuclease
MSHYVYILQNKINLKIYVGYSANPKIRWNSHKNTANNPKHKNHHELIYNAIRKHGWENFDKQIIEEWETKKEALEAEMFWIEFFRTNIHIYGKEYGYNLGPGGTGGRVKGGKLSIEHRRKLSEAHKGRTAWNKGKPSPLKGRKRTTPLTENEKQNLARLADFHRGRKHSPERIEKSRQSRLGKKTKPHTEEHKRKISEAQKGKKKPKHIFSEIIEKQIVQEYKSGKSINKLKIEYKCSWTAIKSILLMYIAENDIRKDDGKKTRKIIRK